MCFLFLQAPAMVRGAVFAFAQKTLYNRSPKPARFGRFRLHCLCLVNSCSLPTSAPLGAVYNKKQASKGYLILQFQFTLQKREKPHLDDTFFNKSWLFRRVSFRHFGSFRVRRCFFRRFSNQLFVCGPRGRVNIYAVFAISR